MLTRLALLLLLGLASGCSSAGTSDSCIPLEAVGGLGGDGGGGRKPGSSSGESQPGTGGQEPDSLCCRVCSAGKACGDSCINRDLTCNQPIGCACNG